MRSPIAGGDDGSRPRAFISFTTADVDAARSIRDAFDRAGFEAWFCKSWDGLGQDFDTTYEDRLKESEVVVCVVSGSYLARGGHCRHEVDLAHRTFVESNKTRPLILPITVDGIRDDPYSVWERIGHHHIGPTLFDRPPTPDELDDLARHAMEHLSCNGPSSFASGPVLPITLRHGASEDHVVLVLDNTAQHAALVRGWMNSRRRIKSSGRDRWTMGREEYESAVKPALEQLISGAAS